MVWLLLRGCTSHVVSCIVAPCIVVVACMLHRCTLHIASGGLWSVVWLQVVCCAHRIVAPCIVVGACMLHVACCIDARCTLHRSVLHVASELGACCIGARRMLHRRPGALPQHRRAVRCMVSCVLLGRAVLHSCALANVNCTRGCALLLLCVGGALQGGSMLRGTYIYIYSTCTYIHVYTYIHVHISIYMCIHICTYIYIYLSIGICMQICVYFFM